LRGVCCCQRMVMGTLTTSPTGLPRAAPMNYLHIYVALLPSFLAQTTANRILGCLPIITYHEGVPFYFSFTRKNTRALHRGKKKVVSWKSRIFIECFPHASKHIKSIFVSGAKPSSHSYLGLVDHDLCFLFLLLFLCFQKNIVRFSFY
jgi:hypothetical protein